jgi:hypothetical protein
MILASENVCSSSFLRIDSSAEASPYRHRAKRHPAVIPHSSDVNHWVSQIPPQPLFDGAAVAEY